MPAKRHVHFESDRGMSFLLCRIPQSEFSSTRSPAGHSYGPQNFFQRFPLLRFYLGLSVVARSLIPVALLYGSPPSFQTLVKAVCTLIRLTQTRFDGLPPLVYLPPINASPPQQRPYAHELSPHPPFSPLLRVITLAQQGFPRALTLARIQALLLLLSIFAI